MHNDAHFTLLNIAFLLILFRLLLSFLIIIDININIVIRSIHVIHIIIMGIRTK